MKKILIIDDIRTDININLDVLKDDEFEFIIKNDEESALNTIEQYSDFHLIIVNTILSEIDGLKFCRKIQETVQCPIIYSPKKIATLNNILGLEMYKNDYIFKPFLIEDLIERAAPYIKDDRQKIRAINENIIVFGGLKISTASSEVYKDGHNIVLSPLEYKLLRFFIDNKEKILTNEQIINCVWGIAYGDNRMLRVAIRRLRSKIDLNNEYIITLRGKGYKLTIPKDKAANY